MRRSSAVRRGPLVKQAKGLLAMPRQKTIERSFRLGGAPRGLAEVVDSGGVLVSHVLRQRVEHGLLIAIEKSSDVVCKFSLDPHHERFLAVQGPARVGRTSLEEQPLVTSFAPFVRLQAARGGGIDGNAPHRVSKVQVCPEQRCEMAGESQ